MRSLVILFVLGFSTLVLADSTQFTLEVPRQKFVIEATDSIPNKGYLEFRGSKSANLEERCVIEFGSTLEGSTFFGKYVGASAKQNPSVSCTQITDLMQNGKNPASTMSGKCFEVSLSRVRNDIHLICYKVVVEGKGTNQVVSLLPLSMDRIQFILGEKGIKLNAEKVAELGASPASAVQRGHGVGR